MFRFMVFIFTTLIAFGTLLAGTFVTFLGYIWLAIPAFPQLPLISFGKMYAILLFLQVLVMVVRGIKIDDIPDDPADIAAKSLTNFIIKLMVLAFMIPVMYFIHLIVY